MWTCIHTYPYVIKLYTHIYVYLGEFHVCTEEVCSAYGMQAIMRLTQHVLS